MLNVAIWARIYVILYCIVQTTKSNIPDFNFVYKREKTMLRLWKGLFSINWSSLNSRRSKRRSSPCIKLYFVYFSGSVSIYIKSHFYLYCTTLIHELRYPRSKIKPTIKGKGISINYTALIYLFGGRIHSLWLVYFTS